MASILTTMPGNTPALVTEDRIWKKFDPIRKRRKLSLESQRITAQVGLQPIQIVAASDTDHLAKTGHDFSQETHKFGGDIEF